VALSHSLEFCGDAGNDGMSRIALRFCSIEAAFLVMGAKSLAGHSR
jgi:hypothetical protein